MNFIMITMSGRRQSQKTHYMVPFLYNSKRSKTKQKFFRTVYACNNFSLRQSMNKQNKKMTTPREDKKAQ